MAGGAVVGELSLLGASGAVVVCGFGSGALAGAGALAVVEGAVAVAVEGAGVVVVVGAGVVVVVGAGAVVVDGADADVGEAPVAESASVTGCIGLVSAITKSLGWAAVFCALACTESFG